MDDDFNTASALAVLFELVRAINTGRAAGVSGPFFDAAQATLRQLAGIFGLTLPEQAAAGDQMAAKPFIDLLIQTRADLRTAKQWALADKIRDSLGSLSIVLEDGADGTTWRYEEQA